MFELKGQYNTASVYASICDEATVGQLMTLLNNEVSANSHIAIMADTHAGKGCVIGTTMTLTDKVIPNLVGVDIGCGMLALKLKEKDISLSKLDKVINKHVPSGMNVHDSAIAEYDDLFKLVAPVNTEYALRSLGTLGGGNHFIELNRDEKGFYWLVIHCGSRKLGVEVCNYHQNVGYEKMLASSVNTDEIIATLKSQGRQREIQKALADAKASAPKINKELAYVIGDDFQNYLHDMRIAQAFAKTNRQLIADIICKKMKFTVLESFDTIHNYIDCDNMILRKGSISAQYGERVLIPINMRDGSLICIGKGNADYNYSAPHGAGRVLSRGQAKASVSMEAFEHAMRGIYTTSVCESTLDESPQAYKRLEDIIPNITDTVDIVEQIKPVYNYKAH